MVEERSMLLHFRLHINQPICGCGWSCCIFFCTVTVFFFSAWIESIACVEGQRTTILVVATLVSAKPVLEREECWLVLLMMICVILRFYYLCFGLFIFVCKFFNLVLCRPNYFNKIQHSMSMILVLYYY